MSRTALVALLALTACPSLPDDSDTAQGTGEPDTADTADTAVPCPEDLFEDNDSIAAAITPTSLPVVGQVCAADEDWYTITGVAGCVTVVDLSFATADGDLDLEVWQGERRLAVSSSTSDNEQARFFLDEAAEVSVRVVGFGGAEAAYSLSLSDECVPCTRPDPFEDNDTFDAAATAPFPILAESCTGDADWYTPPADLQDGCSLDAELTLTSGAQAETVLRLVDGAGATVATGAVNPGGITFRTIGMAQDRLGVLSPSTAVYELTSEAVCPSPNALTCAVDGDDVWANNLPGTAVRLRDGFVASGIVCGTGTNDWWTVPVTEGCTTTVALTSSSTTGLATGTRFISGAQGTTITADGTTVVATVTDAALNQVRVSAADTDANYTIEAHISCPDDN